jgi:hypothetical protein
MAFWFLSLVLFHPEEFEMSDRLAPPGFQGNYWGKAGDQARALGKVPPIMMTPHMARWDRWGRQVLEDGDIVFRTGDARLLRGYFRFSRFLANCSNSPFSHTGIIAIEKGGPFVYDMRGPAVGRQPFHIWILDNVGSIGVKRLKPELRGAIPKVLAYCRKVYQDEVPFDYELSLDDSALYCAEMTQKAFLVADINLSKPIRLGDMERADEFPVCMFGLMVFSRFMLEHPLTFEQLVYFPGNDRYGIWSAKELLTIVPATYAPGYPGLSTGVMPTVRVAAQSRDPRPD